MIIQTMAVNQYEQYECVGCSDTIWLMSKLSTTDFYCSYISISSTLVVFGFSVSLIIRRDV